MEIKDLSNFCILCFKMKKRAKKVRAFNKLELYISILQQRQTKAKVKRNR